MAFALGAACAALYSWNGLRLGATPVFSRNNYLFQSDPRRVITELADSRGNHYRTKVHPIFVLMFNPLGSGLRKLLGSLDTAAIVLNALGGGIAAAAAFLFFLSQRMPLLQALAFTGTLAFSAAHLLYGSVPEAYIFSAASLIVMLWLAFQEGGGWWAKVAAGVVSAGILTSNFALVILIFFLADTRRKSLSDGLRRAGVYAGVVLVIIGAASCLQKVVYPSSRFFFEPTAFVEESKYIPSYTGPSQVFERAGDFLRTLFVFDIVAPEPVFKPGWVPNGSDGQPVTFGPWARRFPKAAFQGESTSVHGAGIVAAVMWVGLLLPAGLAMLRTKPAGRDAVLAGTLLACIGFSLALYMLYGEEPFQYSCNWTFFLIALVAVGLRPIYEAKGWSRTALVVVTVMLPVVLLGANLGFIQTLLRAYQ